MKTNALRYFLVFALAGGALATFDAGEAEAQNAGGSLTAALTPGGKVLVNYTLQEMAKGDIPFCWKRSNTRASSALTCAPGEDQTAGPLGQCYPACRPGFVGWHTVCKQPCPDGYRDDGLTCFRDAHIYGNGCRGGCSDGYKNDGCTCRRDAHAFAPQRYDRGAGHAVNSCPSGMTKTGALCYADCPSGYTPTSSVDLICWQNCPSSQPKACGAGCATSGATCASNTADMVIAPLEVAANIVALVGTGGSANAAKSAAKTAAKTASRETMRQLLKTAINAIKTNVLQKVRTKVEAKLLKKLTREQAEGVMEAAAESLATSALAQDFELKQFLMDLDPTGIAATVDAYNKPMCDPDADPPLVEWSSGGPVQAAVFWTKDTNRGNAPDWDAGSYKATCAATEAVVGISALPTVSNVPLVSGLAHGAMCVSVGKATTQAAVVPAGENRRAQRAGDWDAGFYKGECGTNEFVSGISQTTGGTIHALRCSSGLGASTSCERRLVENGAGYSAAYGDWDPNYFKADCPNNKVVVGVSQVVATGKVHAVLCCDR